MTRGLWGLVFVAWAASASAQSTTIKATDYSTGANVNVGNSVAHSIRIAIVDATGTPFGTSGNPLRVDTTGTTTQPVSGTFWQSVQPVSQATGTNLHMVCDSGCTATSAPADRNNFTYGTTVFSPIGGVYNTAITALSSGQMGAAALTTNRKLHVALFDSADAAITTTAGAIDINIKSGGSAVDANSYALTTNAATATSTGAATACNILSAASTNATSCKGSAGNFYGYEVYNTSTVVYYLRLYNTAAAPTCSSATGFVRTIPIPPASSAGLVGGTVSNQVVPVNYGTGMGYCITGGPSSTDNTNAATGIFGEIRVK